MSNSDEEAWMSDIAEHICSAFHAWHLHCNVRSSVPQNDPCLHFLSQIAIDSNIFLIVQKRSLEPDAVER